MSAEFDLATVERGVLATRFEGRVRHLELVDSTNELALIAARSGEKWGVWVADEQTAGRGRGGHDWHSARGDGLYFSALVSPEIPLSFARDLPIAAGLAVQAAVLETTGLKLDLRWPNDLMFGDRKCGGILVESASEPSPVEWHEEIGQALHDQALGLAVWAAMHGLAMLVLENVIDLGQRRSGLAVLPARAEIILRSLFATRE